MIKHKLKTCLPWYDIDSEFKLMTSPWSQINLWNFIYKNVLHRPARLETIVRMYEGQNKEKYPIKLQLTVYFLTNVGLTVLHYSDVLG